MTQINPILEQALQQEIATEQQEASSQTKLSAVEDALKASSIQREEDRQSLKKGAARVEKLTEDIMPALQDITTAEQMTGKLEDTAELTKQNADIAILEASGGHENQVSLMAELTERGQAVEDLSGEIADTMQEEITGLGPLDMLINSFSTIDEREALKSAEAARDSTAKQIALVTGAQESFNKTNTLTKKTMTGALIEANYASIGAEGKIKATEAEIANIHSNAAIMGRIATADNASSKALMDIYKLEDTKAQREFRKIEMAHSQEKFEHQKERWETDKEASEIQLKAAKLNLATAEHLTPTKRAAAEEQYKEVVNKIEEENKGKAEFANSVRKAQAGLGSTPESIDAILYAFANGNKETQARYLKLRELGNFPSDRGFTIGSNFAEYHNNSILLGEGKGTRLTGTAKLILLKQQEKYKKTGAKIPAAGDIEALNQDLNVTADTYMLQKASNIESSGNPYAAPPMESLVNFMPSITETPFYQKVLKDKQMTEVEPQTIMDAAVAGIDAKVVSIDEAVAGVETLFRAAVYFNNEMEGGFRRLGLREQTAYNTALKDPRSLVERLGLSTTGILLGSPLTVAAVKGAKGEAIFSTPLTIVDLVDETRIQEYIIKGLSSAPATKKGDN